MENKEKLMRKLLLFSITLQFYPFTSYAQNISIYLPKLKYKLSDTIQLKFSNISSNSRYYSAAIESKSRYDSSWSEMEPTLNQIGKVEARAEIKKSKTLYIHVSLPKYLKGLMDKNNSVFVRFRIKSGLTWDNVPDIDYSPPIRYSLF